jgi:hypothetical protein
MNLNEIPVRPVSRLKRLLMLDTGRRARTCRFGLYRGLTFDLDLASETQIWAGLWERETYAFIRRAAKRCAWAIDVGAGHGELCVYLLKRSRASPVFAMEPSIPETVVLTTNLRLSGADGTRRIRVVNKLVGVSSELGFVPLDSLEVDRGKYGFIKIDVDGSECDVLDSGIGLLSQADLCVLVETHSATLERECIGRLERLGYSCQIISNAWWRAIVPERRPIQHNRWLWAAKTRMR